MGLSCCKELSLVYFKLRLTFISKFNCEQGVDAWSGSHPPTKTLPFHGDMTKGRLCHVPASFSEMGCGQPKNHQAVSKQSVFIFLVCTVFAI